MFASVARPAPSSAYRALATIMIVHALLILLFVLSLIYFDFAVIPGRAWLILSWLWFIWPLVLLLHPDRSVLRVLAPCLVSIALLAPCAPLVWALTVLAIGGI